MQQSVSDPDVLALLAVQQYLAESGFGEALEATERATGLKYAPEKLPTGSLLLQMVYDKLERELAAGVDELEIAEREQEAEFLAGNSGDWPKEDALEIAGLHTHNILAVTLWSACGMIFTGSGDQTVRCIDVASGCMRWSREVGGGAVLALAVHPQPQELPLLLASSMDGSVTMLDATDGTILHTSRPHTKYAQRVCWSATGAMFASGSFDSSLCAFERLPPAADGPRASFRQRWSAPFLGTVDDVVALKEEAVVAAVRGDHCLHVLDLASQQELRKVNMNSHGDTHLSFNARHLAVSPDRRFLLVSTDVGRVIMMSTASWKQVRNFYGVPHEDFGNPCAALSPSGHYVIAGAAGGSIWVFHVGTAKIVHKIRAHSINVRHLEVDAPSRTLATCSYDKTVKLWRCGGS